NNYWKHIFTRSLKLKISKLAQIIIVSAISTVATAKTAIFYPIDIVAQDNQFPSTPAAISNHGQVPGDLMVWSPEEQINFGLNPKDISPDGRIILFERGIMKDGEYTALEMPSDGMNFGAEAMSDDGKVRIGVNYGNAYNLWTESDGYLPEYERMVAVSGNGKYLLSEHNITNLDTGSVTAVEGVSRVSSKNVNSLGIVVGRHDGLAFMWQNGVMTEIGGLVPDGYAKAYSLTESGTVIVGQSDPNDPDPSQTRAFQNNPEAFVISEAFIWDATKGLRSLEEMLVSDYNVDLQGWRLANATAISADGSHIAGVGMDADGNLGRWMVRLVDECSELSW
ncbi:MAG: hypothetical protein MI864_21745, partial [Pseudomonadales bacterium]|nr:hypothetical protein [Pseudomonadales bacterium]